MQQLREIDLDKDENLLPLKDMNIGFATETLLKELQKKDVITAKQVKDFREKARMFVVATLKKLRNHHWLPHLYATQLSLIQLPYP